MWSGVSKSSGQVYWVLIDAHGEASPVDGGIISGGDVNDGLWHYVVAVRDNSSEINKLYIDGALIAESEPYNYLWEFGTFVGDPFNIGYLLTQNGTPDYFFQGTLDEVAIYNRALTDTEILNNYLAGGTEHCAPGNFAPIVTSTPITEATEDTPYSYTMTASDIDVGDVLEFSGVTVPGWLNFNTVTGVLSGTPLNANVGDNDVTLLVSDGEAEVEHSFVITVENTNDAPVITSGPPNETVMESSEYNYTFAASDEDVGDVVTLSAVQIPGWLTFTPATGILTGTPQNEDVGNYDIILRASDGTVNTDLEFPLEVFNLNNNPEILDHSDLSTNEDTDITIYLSDLVVEDIDNDPEDLTLIVLTGTNYTFAGNTVTPAANFNGTLTVRVQVHDLVGYSDPYNLPVTINPVNDAPVITSTPIETATEDLLYGYVFSATDVDGDELTFTALVKPTWLTLSPNATNAVLGGIPENDDVGVHSVHLRVSDGTVNVDQEFTITVENVNDPPVITGQHAVSTPPDTPVELTVYDLIVDDPDNQTSELTLTVLTGAQYTFEGTTITPNPGVLGNIFVNVKVSDGLVSSEVYQLTVYVGIESLDLVSVDNLVSVYPNPVRNNLHIKLNTANKINIDLLSITGNVILQNQVQAGIRETEIQTGDLSNGLYILKITETNKVQVVKLIKDK